MKLILSLCLACCISAGADAQTTDTSLLYTNLPLVVISTTGQSISDDPKITAEMKIIYNGLPALNHHSDPGNVYEGLCGIEYRGAYSQSLPQKPYGFETRDELRE